MHDSELIVRAVSEQEYKYRI